VHGASVEPSPTDEQQRIAQLEAELAAAQTEMVRLRRAYTHAIEQLQLLRRRRFVARAERADVSAERIAFDSMFLEVQRLEQALDAAGQKGGDEGQHEPRQAGSPPRGGSWNAAKPAASGEIVDDVYVPRRPSARARRWRVPLAAATVGPPLALLREVGLGSAASKMECDLTGARASRVADAIDPPQMRILAAAPLAPPCVEQEKILALRTDFPEEQYNAERETAPRQTAKTANVTCIRQRTILTFISGGPDDRGQ
jgi:hypothetical protein